MKLVDRFVAVGLRGEERRCYAQSMSLSEKTRGVLILTADVKPKINIPTLYADCTSIT
ncbi:MAG: hypothetical protein QXQ41_03830 [Candidatus Bathyarchaeia archaeon]